MRGVSHVRLLRNGDREYLAVSGKLSLREVVTRTGVLYQYSFECAWLSTKDTSAFGTDVALYDETKVSVMMQGYLKRRKITYSYITRYKEKFTVPGTEGKALRQHAVDREKEQRCICRKYRFL